MKSYLYICPDPKEAKLFTLNMANKLGARPYEFAINKISQVRELKQMLSLKFSQPTAIIIENIDKASLESLNSLLKTLEEPQSNIYFILTAQNSKNVIPTILSRCEVIRDTKRYNPDKESIETANIFYESTIGEKFEITSKIRKRDDALNFLNNLIYYLRNQLKENYDIKVLHTLTKTLNCYKNIGANANVDLNLTNLIVGIDLNHFL